MNKLEHYIKDIKSVTDVTEELKNYVGWKHASKPIVKVNMTVDCFGIVENVTEIFSADAWESVKRNGYYLG